MRVHKFGAQRPALSLAVEFAVSRARSRFAPVLRVVSKEIDEPAHPDPMIRAPVPGAAVVVGERSIFLSFEGAGLPYIAADVVIVRTKEIRAQRMADGRTANFCIALEWIPLWLRPCCVRPKAKPRRVGTILRNHLFSHWGAILKVESTDTNAKLFAKVHDPGQGLLPDDPWGKRVDGEFAILPFLRIGGSSQDGAKPRKLALQ